MSVDWVVDVVSKARILAKPLMTTGLLAATVGAIGVADAARWTQQNAEQIAVSDQSDQAATPPPNHLEPTHTETQHTETMRTASISQASFATGANSTPARRCVDQFDTTKAQTWQQRTHPTADKSADCLRASSATPSPNTSADQRQKNTPAKP